jgi:hypothetical protein
VADDELFGVRTCVRLRRLAASVALGGDELEPLTRRQEAVANGCIGGADLDFEPGARICTDGAQVGFPQAEAVSGDRGGQAGAVGHRQGRGSRVVAVPA